MNKRLITSLFLATVLASTTAAATETSLETVFKRVDGSDIKSIVEDMGRSASLGTDTVNDPLVEFTLNGNDITMYTYDCQKNNNCSGLQLRVAISVDADTRTMNEWNADNSWSRAYTNGSAAILESDLPLEGGVTKEAIQAWINTFRSSVGSFENFLR